ncbi:MAG: tRNA adenosine(34) deaminase TadA [Bacillota bacterium]
MTEDEKFMNLALKQAEKAAQAGEVPIGAVLVKNAAVLAEDRNRREELKDATAHAELLVLRRGGNILGGWRLSGCTLYVTLEPCPMCAGAMVLARVERLVFGAVDPKSGAAGSIYDLVRDQRLNHCLEVNGGVLEKECAKLLRGFFQERRR